MFLKLRVTFTILSAICLGLAIPLGAAIHLIWALVLGVAALMFFVLMLLCKQSQLAQEEKALPPPADFFNPNPESESDKTTNVESSNSETDQVD